MPPRPNARQQPLPYDITFADKFNPFKRHHFRISVVGRITYRQTSGTYRSRSQRLSLNSGYAHEYLRPYVQSVGWSLRRLGRLGHHSKTPLAGRLR